MGFHLIRTQRKLQVLPGSDRARYMSMIAFDVLEFILAAFQRLPELFPGASPSVRFFSRFPLMDPFQNLPRPCEGSRMSRIERLPRC